MFGIAGQTYGTDVIEIGLPSQGERSGCSAAALNSAAPAAKQNSATPVQSAPEIFFINNRPFVGLLFIIASGEHLI
jgi:hypothetical protein